MMHRNIRSCLLGTVITAGLLVSGGVAADAADTATGAEWLLSGTQVIAPVTAPISLSATSVGALGDSTAPNVPANAGVNSGTLIVGVLLLALGALLALVLGRKRP